MGIRAPSIRVAGGSAEHTIALPWHLEQDLDILTDALERPGTDLQAILALLSDDLTEAVPSFLGLTICITVGGQVSIMSTVGTASGPAAEAADVPVAASLQLPLASMSSAEPGSTLRFYASTPGVFGQLAADARAAYGLDGDVVVDQHLHLPTEHDSPDATAAATDVNQAIGVLIAQGHPDPGAELDQRARSRGLTRQQIALQVLAELDGPTDDQQVRPPR